jgi:hypothetical protein
MSKRLDKDTVTYCLEEGEFSPEQRKILLERLFPTSPEPNWKVNLKRIQDDGERWKKFLNVPDCSFGTTGLVFDKSLDELLVRASYRKPAYKDTYTVSDFSSWVYSLYGYRKNYSQLERGKEIERAIADALSETPMASGWELVFQDPLNEQDRPAKKISTLRVNNSPLWGMPDLVFREKKTGKILIVERKSSNAKVPDGGWPNLRTQLWAYSKIDEWADAPEIICAAEIWGFDYQKNLSVRAVLGWNPRGSAYEKYCSDLFKVFCMCAPEKPIP